MQVFGWYDVQDTATCDSNSGSILSAFARCQARGDLSAEEQKVIAVPEESWSRDGYGGSFHGSRQLFFFQLLNNW